MCKLSSFFKFDFSWEKINVFNEESSWAEFKIPENKSISVFHSNNMIIVVSAEGRYYVATFNPEEPGDCIKVEEISMNI